LKSSYPTASIMRTSNHRRRKGDSSTSNWGSVGTNNSNSSDGGSSLDEFQMMTSMETSATIDLQHQFEGLNDLAELSCAFFGNSIPTMNELVNKLEQLPAVIDVNGRGDASSVSPLGDYDEDDDDLDRDDDMNSMNNDEEDEGFEEVRFDALDPASYKVEDIFSELNGLFPNSSQTERREYLFNILIQVLICPCFVYFLLYNDELNVRTEIQQGVIGCGNPCRVLEWYRQGGTRADNVLL
jgi:hypothetical protein